MDQASSSFSSGPASIPSSSSSSASAPPPPVLSSPLLPVVQPVHRGDILTLRRWRRDPSDTTQWLATPEPDRLAVVLAADGLGATATLLVEMPIEDAFQQDTSSGTDGPQVPKYPRNQFIVLLPHNMAHPTGGGKKFFKKLVDREKIVPPESVPTPSEIVRAAVPRPVLLHIFSVRPHDQLFEIGHMGASHLNKQALFFSPLAHAGRPRLDKKARWAIDMWFQAVFHQQTEKLATAVIVPDPTGKQRPCHVVAKSSSHVLLCPLMGSPYWAEFYHNREQHLPFRYVAVKTATASSSGKKVIPDKRSMVYREISGEGLQKPCFVAMPNMFGFHLADRGLYNLSIAKEGGKLFQLGQLQRWIGEEFSPGPYGLRMAGRSLRRSDDSTPSTPPGSVQASPVTTVAAPPGPNPGAPRGGGGAPPGFPDANRGGRGGYGSSSNNRGGGPSVTKPIARGGGAGHGRGASSNVATSSHHVAGRVCLSSDDEEDEDADWRPSVPPLHCSVRGSSVDLWAQMEAEMEAGGGPPVQLDNDTTDWEQDSDDDDPTPVRFEPCGRVGAPEARRVTFEYSPEDHPQWCHERCDLATLTPVTPEFTDSDEESIVEFARRVLGRTNPHASSHHHTSAPPIRQLPKLAAPSPQFPKLVEQLMPSPANTPVSSTGSFEKIDLPMKASPFAFTQSDHIITVPTLTRSGSDESFQRVTSPAAERRKKRQQRQQQDRKAQEKAAAQEQKAIAELATIPPGRCMSGVVRRRWESNVWFESTDFLLGKAWASPNQLPKGLQLIEGDRVTFHIDTAKRHDTNSEGEVHARVIDVQVAKLVSDTDTSKRYEGTVCRLLDADNCGYLTSPKLPQPVFFHFSNVRSKLTDSAHESSYQKMLERGQRVVKASLSRKGAQVSFECQTGIRGKHDDTLTALQIVPGGLPRPSSAEPATPIRAASDSQTGATSASAAASSVSISRSAAPPVEATRKELDDRIDELERIVSCCLCRDRARTHLLRPCMHAICCEVCARQTTLQCPICRQKIIKIERVYIP